MVIFDTTVLIELYRGNQTVKDKIIALGDGTYYISMISVAEFLIGARDKTELTKLEKHISNYTSLAINVDITNIFISNFKMFVLSHRPGIADMLIAATAIYYNLPLYTHNKKHFQFIPGLKLI